jgi:hypothetical protein
MCTCGRSPACGWAHRGSRIRPGRLSVRGIWASSCHGCFTFRSGVARRGASHADGAMQREADGSAAARRIKMGSSATIRRSGSLHVQPYAAAQAPATQSETAATRSADDMASEKVTFDGNTALWAVAIRVDQIAGRCGTAMLGMRTCCIKWSRTQHSIMRTLYDELPDERQALYGLYRRAPLFGGGTRRDPAGAGGVRMAHQRASRGGRHAGTEADDAARQDEEAQDSSSGRRRRRRPRQPCRVAGRTHPMSLRDEATMAGKAGKGALTRCRGVTAAPAPTVAHPIGRTPGSSRHAVSPARSPAGW